MEEFIGVFILVGLVIVALVCHKLHKIAVSKGHYIYSRRYGDITFWAFLWVPAAVLASILFFLMFPGACGLLPAVLFFVG